MTYKAVQQFQIGTVCKDERQTLGTLAAMRQAGYDGIELNGFMIRKMGFSVRMMMKMAGMPAGRGGDFDWPGLLEQAGLSVVGLHEDLGSIERDPEAVITSAKSFRTGYVIVTGMYRFDYGSADAMHDLAKRLNAAGSRLADAGVALLYHNHNAELLHIRPGVTGYEVLIQETDPAFVNFEYDSYWPSEAGADALQWMKLLGSRMRMWHINDRAPMVTRRSKGGRSSGSTKVMSPMLSSDGTELGKGCIPLEGLADQANRSGIDAAIVETHRNWVDGSPVRSLQVSADFMNSHFS